MTESEEINVVRTEDIQDEDLKADLIQAVQLHPDLYNVSTNFHRNKFLREKEWKSVAASINKEELWCKSEWKKLRDNYSKKKKLIIGKTGQARKKIETWPHFQSMQFLDDHLVVAATSGNSVADPEDESANTGQIDVEFELTENSTALGTPMARLPTKANGSDITYSTKRNRSKELDPVDQEFVNFLKRPKEVSDGFHHFGMSIAEDLRKMEPATAGYVKMRITQVMYEAMYPAPSNQQF